MHTHNTKLSETLIFKSYTLLTTHIENPLTHQINAKQNCDHDKTTPTKKKEVKKDNPSESTFSSRIELQIFKGTGSKWQ